MAGRGGYRANSGRKSAKDERLMSLVINKSWDILSKCLDNDYPHYKTSQEDQIKIALELAKKSIPKDLNLSGGGFTMMIVPQEIIDKNELNTSTKQSSD